MRTDMVMQPKTTRVLAGIVVNTTWHHNASNRFEWNSQSMNLIAYKLSETKMKRNCFKATDMHKHNVSRWIKCSLHNSVTKEGELH